MKVIFLFLILFAFVSIKSQTPSNYPTWSLLWSDEFNGTEINNDIWQVKNNYDWYGGGEVFSAEKKYVLPVHLAENTVVNNGYLTITTQFLPSGYSCPNEALNDWGCKHQQLNPNFKYHYSTGSIITQPAYNVKYGFIEARMKFSDVPATWPAFWTYYSEWVDGTQIESEEIDIVELIPGGEMHYNHLSTNGLVHNKFIATTNVHGGHSSCEPHCAPFTRAETHIINDYTQWHTYGIEWTPNKIIFYIDDKAVRLTQNPIILENELTNLIDNFHEIIFGNSINPYAVNGGLWPWPFFHASEISLDFVRVYEMKQGINNQLCMSHAINQCNTNFVTFLPHVKKSISIGGAGCSNSIVGTKVLRASEFVEISGDFTVPIGAELYIDVNSCH